MRMPGSLSALLWAGLTLVLSTAARAPPCKEGQPREFEFTITKEKKAPDGFEREFIVVNGQFPGPHIEINEGDDVEITVHNRMDLNTTIHWHGTLICLKMRRRSTDGLI
jgi:FtsP/CotA-like multicopper oxidase with cupredoxin domain